MKKSSRLLALVLILLMVLALTPAAALGDASSEKLSKHLTPINPAWVEWDENGRCGIEPSRFDVSELIDSYTENMVISKGSIPSSYDLRNYNKTSPVVDQNPNGSCWACAATGSAASILKPTATYQFSPVHLAWFAYRGTEEEENWGYWYYDAAGNQKGPLNRGGNDYDATSSMAAWKGPVNISRAKMPGSDYSPLSSSLRTVADYHLQDSWMLWGNTEAIRQAAKKIVMEEGSMVINYHHILTNSATNPDPNMSSKYAYYQNTYDYSNHAIQLIGWDDNYPRTNFNANCRPSKNGAWLVQNSWGANYVDGGYHWLSYEDPSITLGAAYFVEPATNYKTNYQYDIVGWQGLGYGSDTSSNTAANIFTAKSNESLEAVSFYTTKAGAKYSISIYTGVTADKPTSGTCVLSGQSGTETYSGYHTIELSKAIPLTAGQKFSVVVTFTGGYIPLEEKENGTASVNMGRGGESYIYDDGAWFDVYHEFQGSGYVITNVCIKAFTNPRTEVQKYTVTLPSGTGYTARAASGSASPVNSGGSYSFTVTLHDGYEKGASFAVRANGTALTEQNGLYTISNIRANQTVTVTGVVKSSPAIAVDADHFPDSEFRSYVSENFDLDGDGLLTSRERNAVLEIILPTRSSVASLQGIAYFPELQKLEFYLAKKGIEELDLTGNPKLTYLYCNFSKVKRLDLSACTELVYLACGQNSIQTLDLSACTKLEYLDCGYNQLCELDLTACKQLTDVKSNNYRIVNLDCTGAQWSLDLRSLSNRLDPSRITHWSSDNPAPLRGSVITYTGGGQFYYVYDCGNGYTAQVTIQVSISHTDESIPDSRYLAVPPTCSTAAKYWLSCKFCGLASENRQFSYGDPIPHRYVQGNACDMCTEPLDFVLPDGLTAVQNNAFENAGMSYVRLPDAVQTVGSAAFRGCRNLKYVRFGPNVTYIASDAFAGCSNLLLVDARKGTYAYSRCVELGLIE